MGKPVINKRRRDEEFQIPELRYERLVQSICGDNWRDGGRGDIDGALGVAITKSVLDGIEIEPDTLAHHIGVPKFVLSKSFHNLALSGVFQNRPDETGNYKTRIELDRKNLESKGSTIWCWYAGYASGYIR